MDGELVTLGTPDDLNKSKDPRIVDFLNPKIDIKHPALRSSKPRHPHEHDQQTARVGLFFLLGVALVWVTFETLSDGKIFEEHRHTLIAGFDDLKQLKTGDEVRLAGVKVGSVQLTRLAGRRAEAVLDIDPKIPIAGDASASIVMAGLIGGNYIAIDMGTPGSPPLPDGAEIKTLETPDLNTIMAELGGLGKELQDSLGSFSKAFNATARRAAASSRSSTSS